MMLRWLVGFCLLASPVAAQNYLPGQVTPFNCSAAIATANTAVTLLTPGQASHGFRLQNIDTTEPAWYSVTTTAAAATLGSFVLPPGAATTYAGAGTFEPGYGYGTGGTLTVVAATVGHKISCTAW